VHLARFRNSLVHRETEVSVSDGITLSTEAVSVSFDGLHALSDVTLSIGKGEIIGLIGPNGAGKTTLVNCLSGFQKPSAGRVTLGTRDTAKWKAAKFRRAGIARTFQGGRLFRDMTVQQNVEVTAVALGLSRRAAAHEAALLLNWMGIGHLSGQLASTLPYTDERRVAIARGLVRSPDFLLLDEPAAGMSDHECEELMSLVRSIPKDHGCGILLIEHNVAVVLGLCARIHVLDGGRTLAEGTPADVRSNKSVISAYLGAEAE
jgi:branched-chain amino acid transport system ATP-binding protein